MKKLILATLAIIALTFLIGSVGAFANNTIGFGQLIIQASISVAVEWFSLKALNK